jgi:hypothetical protein
MSEFGNVVSGGIIGKNHLSFPDGAEFIFDFAPIVIAGLIWGKRLIHFKGGMEFKELKSGLTCNAVLNKEGKLFKKADGPLDEFKGTIIDSSNKVLSTVEGSWMDKLLIDDQEFWKLNTTNCYRPIFPK